MTSSSITPLLISFCSAIAAAGAFGVQARRLKLEGAALVVTSANILPDGRVGLTLLNVGARPAFNIEASCSSLKPDIFIEGLEAGGKKEILLDASGASSTLILSYDDLHDGRRTDTRDMSLQNSTVMLGLKRTSKGTMKSERHVISADVKVGTDTE